MGDMNLSQYQSEVLGLLDELASDHPRVVAGTHTRCINWAPNHLIRTFPDRFPEHRDRTWTNGPTTVGRNWIALPSNLLVLETVRHSNGATITAGDWSSVNEQVVTHSQAEVIGLLNKDTATTGYPSLYDRKGYNLLYHPTTRTGFTTTFRLYGVSREDSLSASGATFRLDRDYDEAICLFAAAKLARILGWTERSMELDAAAKRSIGEGISVTDYEISPNVMGSSFEFDAWRVD